MEISKIIKNISYEYTKTKNMKKSIVNERSGDETSELKRYTSKTQIHWKEVPQKVEEQKVVKPSLPVIGILTSRGYRWHYIHETLISPQVEEKNQGKWSDEDIHGFRKKAFNSLMQDLGLGALQKRNNKNVELTSDQQSHLEDLKEKVKAENDAYLRHHPEIGILIKLVYTSIFKNQPQGVKRFVSDYVHHLNKHREELMVEDVVIPFDQPAVPEELTSEEEERRQIRDFAQRIVGSCINLATLGESYVDVMAIIKSILQVVSPSEHDLPIEKSISNAEDAVYEVLMALLKSVSIQRSTSAELVVDDLMDIIVTNALPFVDSDSVIYLEMKRSIDSFIQSLLEQLSDRVMNTVSFREISEESVIKETESLVGDEKTRSILKKELSVQGDDEIKTNKTKVKFQSLAFE